MALFEDTCNSTVGQENVFTKFTAHTMVGADGRAVATRRMKIDQAKAYVAAKLGLEIADLTDETTMEKVRSKLR